VTAGRHFAMDDLVVTPLVSVQASSVNLGGYTETGAGDINLQVPAQNYAFVESGLGVNVARHFMLDDAADLLPEIHVKWLHELLGQNFENIASFTAPGSTSFVTSGLNAAPDTLDLGAGVTLLSCACGGRTWSIETLYDYYWTSGNYSANQVTLAASYRF